MNVYIQMSTEFVRIFFVSKWKTGDGIQWRQFCAITCRMRLEISGQQKGRLLGWSVEASKVEVRRLSILAYTCMYGQVQFSLRSVFGTVTTLYIHTPIFHSTWVENFCCNAFEHSPGSLCDDIMMLEPTEITVWPKRVKLHVCKMVTVVLLLFLNTVTNTVLWFHNII
jgi:hypothetical protein